MMGDMGRTYDGGYAEYTSVPLAQVIPVDTGLPWEVLGALPEMVQTAYGSLTTGLDLKHAAGISAGDTATLDIEATRDWPEPGVPQDLATALAAAPQKIQDLWNEITPMARWEWVRWVNATKNPDTRGRRVDVSISKMRAGRDGPAVSTSPHAPTRTCRRTAGSSSQETTAPDRRSDEQSHGRCTRRITVSGPSQRTSKASCEDRCPKVAACDGLLTAIRPGRVSSALDTTISHVPGRQ